MLWFTSCKFKYNWKDSPFESITVVWFNIVWNELQYSLLYSPFCCCCVRPISFGYILANQRVRMNGPISKGVSSALARAFSGRSAILKIVEELALGTRLVLDLLDCVSNDCQAHSSFSTTISVGSYEAESYIVCFTFLVIYKCLIHSKFVS